MSKLDPTSEKIAELPGMPEPLHPDRQTPVEKVTLPKWPVIPSHFVSCEPVSVIPDAEIEMDPNWLVISMVPAEAAIGRANASSAKITTRLI